MGFLPCAQGNIGKEGKQLLFLLHILNELFLINLHYLDSSVSRASVHGLKGTRFESLTNIFFIFFYYSLLENASLICKNGKRPVLYGNVMNLIIHALKVLISKILLKKYYSTMRCGLDLKNELKGDYNWFRLAITKRFIDYLAKNIRI